MNTVVLQPDSIRLVRRTHALAATLIIGDREIALAPAQLRAVAEVCAKTAADIERERER